MTNIQKMPADTAPAPRNDGASLLSIIERAAVNPDVDIDKMERLFLMHERMQLAAARTAHMAALTQMQAEIPTHIEERGGIKDRNQRVQSSYALWEDVNQAIRPVLHKHGFAVTFRTAQDAGSITVTGVLSHEAGHCETASITLPHDSSGSKNAVQAIASSITYGKRYTAGELLNFTSGKDEADDDGNGYYPPATLAALREMNKEYASVLLSGEFRIVMEADIGSTQYTLFKKTNKLKIQLVAGVQNNILNFNTFVLQCERLN